MTNLEWVLENQEKLIKENLYVDRAIDIALGKIALEEVLSWNLSVNVEQQKLVKTEASQEGDKRYIYYNTSVKEWLQAERKELLKPAYPIGTALFDEDKNVVFYNGLNLNKEVHLLTYSADKIGDVNRGISVTDVELETEYKLLTICDISPAYPSEYLVAKRQ